MLTVLFGSGSTSTVLLSSLFDKSQSKSGVVTFTMLLYVPALVQLVSKSMTPVSLLSKSLMNKAMLVLLFAVSLSIVRLILCVTVFLSGAYT